MTYFSSHLIWPAQTDSPVTVLMVVGAHSSICPGRVDLASCGKSLVRPRFPDSSRLLILSVILLIVWNLFLADCGENWEVSSISRKQPKDLFVAQTQALSACMNFHVRACACLYVHSWS